MKIFFMLLLTFALAYGQSANVSAKGGFGAKVDGKAESSGSGQGATEIQPGETTKTADEPDAPKGDKGEAGGKGDAGGKGEGGGKGEAGGKLEGSGNIEVGGKVEGGSKGGQGGAGQGSQGQGQAEGHVETSGPGGVQVGGSVSSSNEGIPGVNSFIKGVSSAIQSGIGTLSKPFVDAERGVCFAVDQAAKDIFSDPSNADKPFTVSVDGKVVHQGTVGGNGQAKGGNKRSGLLDKLKGLKDLKDQDKKGEKGGDGGKDYGKGGKGGKGGKDCDKDHKKHAHKKHGQAGHVH